MNFWDILILLGVAGLAAFAFFLSRRGSGSCHGNSCCGSCDHCAMGCHCRERSGK